MAKATNSKLETYIISYGLLGGPLAGRRLRKLLAAAGYTLSTDTKQADIVLAHSAGCWQLDNTKARLFILIGLPLAAPGLHTSFRTNKARTLEYIKHGHLLAGLEMTGMNLFYGLAQTRRNYAIIHNAKRSQTAFKAPPKGQIVLIINQHDPWPQGDKLQMYLRDGNWSFISLPGSHDDIWENPDRYIAIINHYARLLA